MMRSLAAAYEVFLALQRFIRLPAFGFSALLALLGAASVAPGLPAWRLWGLLGATLAFHQFGYVLNDVIDLPIDRLHPGRAGYPLVRGWLKPWHALAYALAQIPLAFAISAWLGAGVWAYAALAAAFLGLGVYDMWGKRTRLPPLTDALQGLGWAALALYGAIVAGGAPARLSWILAAWVVLYIVLVNGVHGSLRDLTSDTAAGALTTAILLGARPGARAPLRLLGYTAALQAALAALALWPLLGGSFGYAGGEWAGVFAATLAIQAACAWCSALLFWPRAGLSIVAPVMGYIILSLVGLIVLFGPYLAPTARAFVLASYFGPLVVHDSFYRVVGWLWRRCRPALVSVASR